MDGVRGMPGVPGSVTVHERRGSQRQADAFRRALQQEAESTGRQAGGGDEQPPLRRQLQPTATAGRKDEGTARHVDVIA